MRRSLPTILAAGILIHSPLVLAREAANIRALQIGPVGSGSAFTEMKREEFEYNILSFSRNAEATAGPNELKADAQGWRHSLGWGRVFNPEFHFTAALAVDTEDFTAKSDDFEYSQSRSSVTINAGPTLRTGNLVLGSQVWLTKMNDQTTEISRYQKSYSRKTPGVQLPALHGYIGIVDGHSAVIAGVKTFNGKKVTADIENADGDTIKHGVVQYSPGLVHLDWLWYGAERMRVAAGFTLLVHNGSQVSHPSDGDYEFSGLSDTAKDNQIVWDLGARYSALPTVDFVGGIKLVTASHDSDAKIGLQHDELGSYKFSFGIHSLMGTGRFFFDVDYGKARTARFEALGKNSDDWVNAQETVSIAEESWALHLGAALVL